MMLPRWVSQSLRCAVIEIQKGWLFTERIFQDAPLKYRPFRYKYLFCVGNRASCGCVSVGELKCKWCQ